MPCARGALEQKNKGGGGAGWGALTVLYVATNTFNKRVGHLKSSHEYNLSVNEYLQTFTYMTKYIYIIHIRKTLLTLNV